MKKCKGFTLAEVLITLSILGVIAAVTIPSIQRNFQGRIQLTQFKQAYATLDSAIRQMYAVEGNPVTWDWPDNYSAGFSKKNSDYFGEKLSKYLNISKFCTSNMRTTDFANHPNGCLVNPKNVKKFYCEKANCNGGNISYATLNQNVAMLGTLVETSGAALILKNGMVISLGTMRNPSTPNSKKISERVRIDINGDKRPNKYGYDVFFFVLTDKGIEFGDSRFPYNGFSLKEYCDKDDKKGAGSLQGSSCAYWVFKHGNMDYKYRDVSSEW